jgi:hypothetical protein
VVRGEVGGVLELKGGAEEGEEVCAEGVAGGLEAED